MGRSRVVMGLQKIEMGFTPAAQPAGRSVNYTTFALGMDLKRQSRARTAEPASARRSRARIIKERQSFN